MRVDSGTQTRTGISQASFIFTEGEEASEDGLYPFQTREEYIQSLIRYSTSAVRDRKQVNGYTFDPSGAA